MDDLLSILILEHDADDIELIQYELRKGGIVFNACIAHDQGSYEHALKDFSPQIILSDYSLPSFDGIHAFRIKQEICPDIPFLFVSGAIGEENSIELIKSGVTDYVLKDKLFTLPLKIDRAMSEWREKQAKREAEQKLIKSEKLLAEAQAIARMGNWEIDMVGHVHTWSDEFFNIFGIDRARHQPSRELFLSYVIEEDREQVGNAMQQSQAIIKDSSFNFRFRRSDGEMRHGRSEWKFDLDDSGRPLRQYGIVQDITESVKAEQEILRKNEELRNLSGHLQNIREDERKHIAREIHDELGQQLTALKMDIGWVMHKQPGADEAVTNKLKDVLKLCDDVINTVRRISSELRPAIIDDLGLIAALEWKCNDFEEKTGMACQFISEIKERKFDNDIGINIYRILQETLTNVSRHAEAKAVFVYLSESPEGLVLEVRDDGKGIPDERVNNGKTLGIIGMKERAKLLGGTLEISGTEGKGTCTKLILPNTK